MSYAELLLTQLCSNRVCKTTSQAVCIYCKLYLGQIRKLLFGLLTFKIFTIAHILNQRNLIRVYDLVLVYSHIHRGSHWSQRLCLLCR